MLKYLFMSVIKKFFLLLIVVLFCQLIQAQNISYRNINVCYNVKIDTLIPTITGEFNGRGAPRVTSSFTNNPNTLGFADGAKGALFNGVTLMKMGINGNLYLYDKGNNRIRELNPYTGITKTYIGSNNPNQESAINLPFLNSKISNFVTTFAIDPRNNGILFLDRTYDYYNILNSWVFAKDNKTTPIYSKNSYGSIDGNYYNNKVANVTSMDIDELGNVYFTENSSVRKMSANGTITTICGNPNVHISKLGFRNDVRFTYLEAIKFDKVSGNLFVIDDNKIINVSLNPTNYGSASLVADGTYEGGIAEKFGYIKSIAMDINGNIYTGDIYAGKIYKVTPTGVVTKVAGGNTSFESNQTILSSEASFSPKYIEYDNSTNNIYSTDGDGSVLKHATGKFSISPSLPYGLKFDPITGKIYGKLANNDLNGVDSINYTVSAYHDNNVTNSTFTIHYKLTPYEAVTDTATNVKHRTAILNGTLNVFDPSYTNFKAHFRISHIDTIGVGSYSGGFEDFDIDLDSMQNGKIATKVIVKPGKNYTYQLYVSHKNGYNLYGSEKSFTTPVGAPILLSTLDTSNVDYTKAVLGGNISDDKGDSIIKRGVIYAIDSVRLSYNIDTTQFLIGSGAGVFSSTITGLTPGVIYYAKAFATNLSTTNYGNIIKFLTKSNLPDIGNSISVDTSTIRVVVSGSITDDKGDPVLQRGIVYGLNSSLLDTAHLKVISGVGIGNFSSTINGLVPNTQYYAKLYAYNSSGIQYSSIFGFKTKVKKPILSSVSSVSDVAYVSAIVNGNIVSDQGDSLTERGAVYSTTMAYLVDTSLIENNINSYRVFKIKNSELGIGSFQTKLTGLSIATTYYTRSYARNISGYSFSSNAGVISFTTNTAPPAPDLNSSYVSNLGTHSVLLSGRISNNGAGGDDIKEKGFIITAPSGLTNIFKFICNGNGYNFDTTFTQLASNTSYEVKAYAINAINETAYSPAIPFTTLSEPQAPFLGTSINLPGRIEAEYFDKGDDGVAFHEVAYPSNLIAIENRGIQGSRQWDPNNLSFVENFRSTAVDIEVTNNEVTNANGKNYQVAYITEGEWLKYTVNVNEPITRDYQFLLHAARAIHPDSVGKVSLEVDGVLVADTVSIRGTRTWGTYFDNKIDFITLSPGVHEIKINFLSSGARAMGLAVANLNYIDVLKYPDGISKDKYLKLDLNFAIDSNLSTHDQTAVVKAKGLKPDAPYKVVMHSTPVVLASGTTDAYGNFNRIITLPSNTPAGKHSIDVSGIDSDNNRVGESTYITVNNLKKITEIINLGRGNITPDTVKLTYSSNTDTDTANSLIAKFNTVDYSRDVHEYSLIPGVGDTDNSIFRISNDSLFLLAIADYETRNEYRIRVRTTDNAENILDSAIVIHLINSPNDPAGIKSNGGGLTATINMYENNELVTTVNAVDPQNNNIKYQYSIAGGIDSSRFSITSNSGKLKFLTIPNFEIPNDSNKNNVYEVTVKATNLLNPDVIYSQKLTINILDTIELPKFNGFIISDVKNSEVKFNAIVDNGGVNLIKKGVLYALKDAIDFPTLNDSNMNGVLMNDLDTTSGTYKIKLIDLAENSNYIARSYAINNLGVSYSDTVSFTTNINSSLPTVSYPNPAVITQNSEFLISPIVSGATMPNQQYKTVINIAGTGLPGDNNGNSQNSTFRQPNGMALSTIGEIFVVDAMNNQIRVISKDGKVNKFSGSTKGANNETINGIDTSLAKFNNPSSIAIDDLNNIYISDKGNNQIRKISNNGIVTRIAGADKIGDISNSGNLDGIGDAATFNQPEGLALDKDGRYLYVADKGNNLIRKIDIYTNNVTTVAGNGNASSVDNTTGILSSFNAPVGLAISNSGFLYVSDYIGNKIRRINLTTSEVKTLASGLNGPIGLQIDPIGNVYFAETNSNKILRLDTAGAVSTFAGTGAAGSSEGNVSNATFDKPSGLLLDPVNAVLYISHASSNSGTGNKIRSIGLAGYSINQTLPTWLKFNNKTGEFAGTPLTVVSPFNLKIYYANLFNSDSTIINIEVLSNLHKIRYTSPQVYKTDFVIEPLIPIVQGPDFIGNADGDKFTISPELPSGLIFNKLTGIISGTPSVITDSADYYISGWDSTVSTTAKLSLKVILGAVNPTLSFANITKTYGDNAFTIAASSNSSGVITYNSSNNLVATISGNTVTIVGAGTASITASQTEATGYFAGTAISTLNINKAPLTVIAEDKTKVYGAANPAFTVTYAGFKGSDNEASLTTAPTASTTATTTSGVGTYTVTAAGGVSDNYEFAYTAGTLAVSKATLNVTAENKTKVYGAANPAFTVTYAGFKGSDNEASLTTAPTASTTATTTSGVGAYSVTAAGGVSDNYEFAYTAGTLAVTKSILTVTADNASRCFAATDPTLTYKVTGYLNGDDATVLTTKPTVATDAVSSSAAGDYKTTASGAVTDNYDVVYVDGKFKVNPLPVGSITSSVDYVCDGAVQVLSATGGASYVWYKEGTVITGATEKDITIASKGNYNAKLISALGCEAMSTNTLAIKQYYAPTADFTSLYSCINVPVLITNKSVSTTAGTVKYAWEDGAGGTSSIASPSFTYGTLGAKTIKLTVTPDYCPALKQSVSKVVTIETPTPAIALPVVQAITYTRTPLQARTFGASYDWKTITSGVASLSSSRVSNPVLTTNAEAWFNITITAPNGCVTVDTLQAIVFTERTVFLPNAFTPNGDGVNDVFKINPVGVNALNYFRIFNQWGQIVFETRNLSEGWDGKLNGVRQPLATYNWILDATDIYGNSVRESGSVTLIR